jgi:hypothetical protein
MAWMPEGDGLKLTGDCHYDATEIERLIEQLRQARNQPEAICRLLTELLETGKASKELVWRLSKWCDWDDPSERVARTIAGQLFHSIICRRLRDQRNRPIPDRVTAESDYKLWLDRVVQAGRYIQTAAVFPDEVDDSGPYLEGQVRRVSVNSYERNPDARARCLAHYGTACVICGFDFGNAYDGIGTGYIHVHHLNPLAAEPREHEVDPIVDLRPVCPNCHVVIHLYRQPFTINEVKAMVNRAREKQQARCR